MQGSRDVDRKCRLPAAAGGGANMLCHCTHDGDCYRGWMDIEEDGRDYTVPCATCRPNQRRITQMAASRESMQMRLQERASNKQDWGK